MKILLAEDNNEKLGKLLEVLRSLDLKDGDIDVAYTAVDAKRSLISNSYDLLILDVLLPLRSGDAPKLSNSLDLLTELTDRTTMRRPRHILGLTAYDDAIRDAASTFASKTWSVVKYSPDKDDWREQVRNAVSYILEAPSLPDARKYRTDVCLLTALASPEYDALMRLDWKWAAAEPLDDNTFVRRGTFMSRAKSFSVVAAFAPRMGMVSASLLAAKLIEREAPRFIVMSGICGGVRTKTNIGDVLVADPSWDWQSGKHFALDGEHGFAIAPEPLPLATFVRARMDQLRQQHELLGKIRRSYPKPNDAELKLKVGPVASGSSVLADSDMIELITKQNRNLVGVEMEAYGVAAAARFAPHPRPTAIICKGVCDFADELKNSEWQEYAAHCSVHVVREFFEIYMHEISDLAGSQ